MGQNNNNKSLQSANCAWIVPGNCDGVKRDSPQ